MSKNSDSEVTECAFCYEKAKYECSEYGCKAPLCFDHAIFCNECNQAACEEHRHASNCTYYSS